MRALRFLSIFALGLSAAVFSGRASATPLDDYVAAPDPAFRYEAQTENDVAKEGFDAHAYHLVSQEWLTPEEVDRTLWEHDVMVYVPKDRQHTTALFFINGGSNRENSKPALNPALGQIAMQTHAVVVDLKQIPNQPLHFTEEKMDAYKESGRVEDALITYGWDKFLRGGRPEWLARLPMTKAVVRAMDMVQKENPEIENFFVMGGSKRAWTTWTTAAVDKRVVGIAPAVIDVLNFIPSLENHHAAYGFWAPAVQNYEEMGIMDRLHTPEMKELLAIVEPYSYKDRLTMPKYIVNSAGDQFFTPDSSKFYFDGLEGEKYVRYMPNTDHGLSAEAYFNAASFFSALVTNTPRPEFTWSIGKDGAVDVHCTTLPKKVKLWQAYNPDARDFRLEAIGKAYTSTDMEIGDGDYHARPEVTEKGYTAFFIEMQFDNPSFSSPFVFTTGVSILPDTYPGAAKP